MNPIFVEFWCGVGSNPSKSQSFACYVFFLNFFINLNITPGKLPMKNKIKSDDKLTIITSSKVIAI
jgi:hypothetical protein